MRHFYSIFAILSVLTLTGCAGVQSALDPAGEEATRIAHLFWGMLAGAAVIWLGVLLLTAYAAQERPDTDRTKQAHRIILCGALLPAVVLSGLLIFGLSMLPELLAEAPEDALRIHVHGEQWWWRVRYEPKGWAPFETANEIRLAAGDPVEFLLHSSNVVHSFWIPALGGKMDMMPGRTNRLVLHPVRTGSYRGVCAEYCGAGHANMAFHVEVVTREEFQRWLADRSRETLR